MQAHVLRFPLALVLAASAVGCHEKSEVETDKEPTAEQKTAETAAAKESSEEADKLAVWPDGWVVASEEEWIPVLTEVGRDLSDARDEFSKGDRDATAKSLQAAAKQMRADANDRSGEEQKNLTSAAKQLEDLAGQMHKGGVNAEAFDKTLANAYHNEATVSWLYMESEAWAPTFERPKQHFQQALRLLDDHQDAAAADEIRRGAGFFRLAAGSARSDDRSLLDAQVKKLDELAQKADDGNLKAPELRAALAKVDAAYASSYLHVAEAAYNHKQKAESRRAFREAAARIRSRAHWMGDKVDAAETAIADELDRAGDAIADTAELSASKVKDLLKRARKAIGGDGTSHPEHAG